MVIPVGKKGSQEFFMIDKDKDGNIKKTKIADVSYVPLI